VWCFLSVTNIQNAYNPELFHSRSVLRPLTNKEQMQRANALCKSTSKGLSCSGQIFVGMFFDGTGNNQDADYTALIKTPADLKHSNVVRLYHAYPGPETRGTNKYYRYYIPGVGTKFDEIGDDGGTLGTAAAWNGEPRLIWGMLRMYDAVADYVSGTKFLEDKVAGMHANDVGGFIATDYYRNETFFKKTCNSRLKALVNVKRKDRPRPDQINLSVYGFSRGAAEARAFVNWLYEVCDIVDGAYQFCGIPLRIQFLGIWDTVASVGVAGGFTSGLIASEGHQSWAKHNMQVHSAVESCMHIVAAHEVRATFPLDSVRIDGVYPPNCKEYVYPGAHSYVGGGYHPKAYGKTDALSRIAGFEMYCAALAQGVPFLTLDQLDKKFSQNLLPSPAAVDVFTNYMNLAAIKAAPVEEMMHQHMAHYFTYRYQARLDPAHTQAPYYLTRRFFKESTANFGDKSNKSTKEYLQDTQQHFIAILAALKAKLDDKMRNNNQYDAYIKQPFQDPLILDKLPKSFFAGAPILTTIVAAHEESRLVTLRSKAITDSLDNNERDKVASQIQETVKNWRQWLADHHSPDLMDADAPERDILSIVDTLSDKPQDPKMVELFDDWVHDSVAGIAHDKVNEFVYFGVGIAKFRRIFFGNNEDAMIKEKANKQNEQRIKVTRGQRKQDDIESAQRAQWDRESADYANATRGWDK